MVLKFHNGLELITFFFPSFDVPSASVSAIKMKKLSDIYDRLGRNHTTERRHYHHACEW